MEDQIRFPFHGIKEDGKFGEDGSCADAKVFDANRHPVTAEFPFHACAKGGTSPNVMLVAVIRKIPAIVGLPAGHVGCSQDDHPLLPVFRLVDLMKGELAIARKKSGESDVSRFFGCHGCLPEPDQDGAWQRGQPQPVAYETEMFAQVGWGIPCPDGCQPATTDTKEQRLEIDCDRDQKKEECFPKGMEIARCNLEMERKAVSSRHDGIFSLPPRLPLSEIRL